MRHLKVLFLLILAVVIIWYGKIFADNAIRKDTVKQVIFTSFCINGDVSADYGASSRYTTFPGRSSSTFPPVAAATYPGTNCNSDTEIVLQNFDLPAGLAAGDTVCLWDHDPAPIVDCGDATPPTISNLQASNISQTAATITWSTDETATHTLKYGTSSSSYDSYPNSKSAGSGTSASVTLP